MRGLDVNAISEKSEREVKKKIASRPDYDYKSVAK